ncbi:alpha/beta hydrolase [Agromyces kandeliae]|uniref:Alpha/beta hydrolase n=1 Tax=Agromyces kandeliae TaxID=2666141 RepID=A0A6L5R350_9MICO|nr:alpha/beta hydrolase [Agromyces kandeliae]MRX44463.1 alpha/beta hydrolase [Agromyces kandeliae]
MSAAIPATPADAPPRRAGWGLWVVRIVAIAALLVVGWAGLTAWGAIVHGHPAYGVLLVATAIGAVTALALTIRRTARSGRSSRPTRSVVWRRVGRVALVALAVAWIGVIGWLRPYPAVEPALTAMVSDELVDVTETPTGITLAPTAGGDGTGVFFQPGALVDARAYAAVLRPLAEAGHTVVIAKQPLGIAFLAVPAFDEARSAHPAIERWVLGGHSLGGTVAAMQADDADDDVDAPAAGLLLFASYPAGDVSESLTVPVESISGSRDGLATPSKIEASRTDLPTGTGFTEIAGASHAQFGDYGPQAGDGTPELTDDEARALISEASLAFVSGTAD